MSSFAAASLVIGVLLVFCVPAFYYIFYVDGTRGLQAYVDDEPPEIINEDGIKEIEEMLNVTLPVDYINLVSNKRAENIDSTSVFDNVESIIEFTTLYRQGFEGLPAWPQQYLYVGDESDACPYILNTISGTIAYSDKGNINKIALREFTSMRKFIDYFNE